MKKIVFILTCFVFILCLSSCRSTSSSCGLADNVLLNQTIQNNTDVV